MSIKVIANMGELMRKAKAEAKAIKEGNPNKIKKAKDDHEAYKKICLDADEIQL